MVAGTLRDLQVTRSIGTAVRIHFVTIRKYSSKTRLPS